MDALSSLLLSGNWVDLLVLVLIIFYLWEGVERGFILGLIDLGGFLLSFLVSIKLYSPFAQLLIVHFSLSRGIANASAFLLIGFFAQIAYSYVITYVYNRIPHHALRAKWNTVFGFIPSLGSALVFSAFFLTLLTSLPITGSIKSAIINGKLSGVLVRQTQGVEKELRGVFGEAVNETLTFFTVSPGSTERIDLNFTQKEYTVSPVNEQEMFRLVNEERRNRGLKELKLDNSLRDVARAHAKDMFVRGYFSHYTPEGLSPFDRMKQANIMFLAAGENLALAPNVELAHQGLMNSPGHKANILSEDFGKVGIGAIDGGIYGVMFVQEFTD